MSFVKYDDSSGDLLFFCGGAREPVLLSADTGERLVTYTSRPGKTWSCDVSRDSKLLIIASGDMTVKLRDVNTGYQSCSFDFDSPARAVDFAEW